MTTFDERERAFENLFVHDEEVRFRVRARRNKAVASWASGLLGQSGAVAAAYQDEIVASAVTDVDDAAFAQRIADDLAHASRSVTVADIRAEMDRQTAVALQAERSV